MEKAWGKGKLLAFLVGIQTDPATLRTVWRFLKKLVMKLPYDPIIPLLGIYPEKIITEKDTCMSRFIAALFIIARMWKQLRCPPIDEWIKEMWYIYTMEYYSALKKECI